MDELEKAYQDALNQNKKSQDDELEKAYQSAMKGDSGAAYTVETAASANPDAVAGTLKTAQSLDVPPELIESDPASAENVARSKRIMAEYEASHPATRKYMGDYYNAAVSHDDLENLNGIATSIDKVASTNPKKNYRPKFAYDDEPRGFGPRNANVIGMTAAGMGADAASFLDYVTDGAVGADWAASASESEKAFMEAAARAYRQEEYSADYWDKLVSGGTSFAAFMGPGLVAAPITGAMSVPALAGLAWAIGSESAVEAGGQFRSVLEETGGDREKAGRVANRTFWANAALLTATDAVTLGQGKWLAGALSEGLQEAFQTVVGERSRELEGGLRYMDGGELLGAAVESGIYGAILGGTGAGAGQLARYGIEYRKETDAKQTRQDVLTALGNSAQASKTRERLPENLRKVVESIRENNPDVTDVYIDAAKAAELFQTTKEGKPLSVQLEELGITPEVMAQAVEVGGDVKIPLEIFVEKVAGNADVYNTVINDVRFGEDDFSINEREEKAKELQARMEEIKGELEKVEGPDIATVERIYSTKYEELLSTGTMSKEEASANAKLYAAIISTTAKERGEDLGAFYESVKGAVVGPVVQKVVGKGSEMDVWLDNFRSWATGSRDVKGARGKSLLSWIRSKGGARDYGGELKAMGAKKILNKNGMELDRLAMSAVDEGFFPELGGEPLDLNDFIEAIRQEIAGEGRYQKGGEAEAATQEEYESFSEALRIMGIKETATNEEIKKAMAGVGQGQPAYHGSPYKFDKFTLDHIGKGEGAQAYGWGLYFAEKKDVAEWYKNQLSQKTATVVFGHGKTYKWDSKVGKWEDDAGQLPPLGVRTYLNALSLNNFDEKAAIARVNAELTGFGLGADAFKNLQDTYPDRYGYESIKIETEISGAGYKVELTPQDDEWLLWDKPLSEQSEKVKAALRAYQDTKPDAYIKGNNTRTPFPYYTGQEVYTILKREEGSDISASMALRDAGIPGIKYLDGTSRDGGDPSYNFVVFDDSLIKIEEMFQDKEGERRGSFDPLTHTIKLFEAKNLTTFAHESMHLATKILFDGVKNGTASKQEIEDAKALLKFVGLPENTADFMTNWKKYEDQHEAIAAAWEAYLMEGKAPTTELQGIFDKFFAWFSYVYKKLASKIPGYKIPLNDEVRRVFDRRIATQEEIAAASKNVGADILLKAKGIASKLSKAAIQRIAKQKIKANAAAIAALEAKKVKELTKVASEAWQKFVADEEAKIIAELRKEPVYAAINYFAKGELEDGTKAENPVKLNKSSVEKAMKGATKYLPRGSTQNKGGVDAQTAADMFGFETAGDMLSAMISAPDMNKVARERAEAEASKFGTEQGFVAQAAEGAMEAVHNSEQYKLLTTEMAVLQEAAEMKKQRKDDRVYQEQAARVIAETPIRELNPTLFVRRQTKYAKQAAEMTAKGKYAEAVVAKEKQILAFHLYQEALAAKTRADKQILTIKDIARKLKKKDLIIDDELAEQLRWIIFKAAFDAEVKKDLRTEEGDFIRWLEAAVAEEREDVKLLDYSDEARRALGKGAWKEFTVAELEGLTDTVKSLYTLARKTAEFQLEGKRESFRKVRDAVLEELGKLPSKTMDVNAASKGRVDKFLKALRGQYYDLANLETVLRELDNDKELGLLWQLIYRPLYMGGIDKNAMMMEAGKAFKALRDKLPSASQKELIANDRIKYDMENKLGYPKKFTATKADVIGMALNWGNEENRQRLTDGHDLSPESIEALFDKVLSKEDWAFVTGVWQMFDGYFNKANEVAEKLSGSPMYKTKFLPVVTKHGIFQGGYFPIAYDSDYGGVTGEQQATNLAKSQASFVRAKANDGFTKQRSKVVEGRRLLIDLNIIDQHLTDVTTMIGLGEAIIQVDKVIRDRAISAEIVRVLGIEALTELKLHVKAVARQLDQKVHWSIRGLNKITANASIAAMALKVSTALSQFAGFAPIVKEVGLRNFTKALWDVMSSPIDMYRDITALDPWMTQRFANRDATIREFTKVNLFPSKTEQYRKAMQSFVLTGYADAAVCLVGWQAAYTKKLDETGDQRAAIDYANYVIRLTQGDGREENLAPIQRQTAMKSLLRFYTPMSALFQQMAKYGGGARRGKYSSKDIAFFAVFNLMLASVLAEVFAGRFPSDDEPEDIAKWLAARFGEYPLMVYPIIRDVIDLVVRRDVDLLAAETLAKSLKRTAEPLFDEDKELDGAWLLEAFNAAGMTFGLPSGQVRVIMKAEMRRQDNEDVSPIDYLLAKPAKK